MTEYVLNLTLDINCQKSITRLFMGQYDIGRKAEVTVTADGEPYSCKNCTVVCQGVRGNHTHFVFDCEVNSAGHIITTFDEVLKSSGIAFAKFVISDSDHSYSTQQFIIDCNNALLGNINNNDDYITLSELIDQVHALTASGAVLVDKELSTNSSNPVANYVIASIISDINQSIGTKQLISNMFSSRYNLDNRESSYPSIKYLETYYYDQEDVDDFLDLKADKTELLTGLNGKQTAQYITDTITTANDLIALNDVNTVYNGVMSGFSSKFGQTSDSVYLGFRMWFDLTSPKEANSYERIISLSDGSMWSANGSGSNINYRQISYNKKQVDNFINSKVDKTVIETGTAPITITGYTKDDFYALNCRYQKVGDYCYITFTANPKVTIDSPLVFSGLPFVAYNTFILAAYTGKNNPIKIEITNNTSYLTITKISGEAFSAGETNTFTIGHRIKS